MKVLSVFIALACFDIQAAVQVLTIPELVVEISAQDLVPLEPKRESPRLDPRYGSSIAALIIANKPRLLACLPEKSLGGLLLQYTLSIESSGKGSASTSAHTPFKPGDNVQKCIVKILNDISYPSHNLSGPVSVNLPLSIERKVL